MDLTLNKGHKIRYFSDPSPAQILRDAARFIETNPDESINTFQMHLTWIDGIDYEGYLIYGGW